MPLWGEGKNTFVWWKVRKMSRKKKEIKRKEKRQKKRKNQKMEKKEKFKKKKLFLVVLDKICVFCLYPIPDSQQYVKRGSCRRLILSGLLCLFSFWASGPFVTSFEFRPRILPVFTLSSLWVVLYFVFLSLSFVVKYFSCRFVSCHVF